MTFDEWAETQNILTGRVWTLTKDAYEAGAASVGHTDCIARVDASNWRGVAKLASEQVKAIEYERDAERERAEKAEARVKELEAACVTNDVEAVQTLDHWMGLAIERLGRIERAASERERAELTISVLREEVRLATEGSTAAHIREGAVIVRADKAEAALRVAKNNATCNCVPFGNTIECGLSCECRCHEMETRAWKAEKERDAALAQVASRQGEFQKLWQTVYDYAKRHCWDEAEDRADGVGKIWDALMHAHAFIPFAAPKGKP